MSHFAINCGDVARAKDFYEGVFGWKFAPWGPPDFYNTQDAGVMAALQKRRELVPGKAIGFECTIGVPDIDTAIAAILASGGRIVMNKATIPTVGTLVFFEDTEGNIAGAMQYESR
jgi:predicted enzyme related to lactoylglutathione lyase